MNYNASICCGNFHTLILDSNHKIWGSGSNLKCQLGFSGITNHYKPVELGSKLYFIKIYASGNFTLALNHNGTLFVVGSNSSGQLGSGYGDPVRNFYVVPNLPVIDSVSACVDHTILLDEDGNVFTCGSNQFGQSGHDGGNIEKFKKLPFVIPRMESISAGFTHSLMLDYDNNVWIFGKYCNEEHFTPKKLEGIPHMLKIQAGRRHSLLLDYNGCVWGFGQSENGQLGLGFISKTVINPVIIDELPFVREIYSWHNKSFIIDVNGDVWATGSNSFGELGIGDIEPSGYFTKIPELSGIVHITGGLRFTLFVNTVGTIYASGTNGNGEFGSNKKITISNTPIELENWPLPAYRSFYGNRNKSARN